MNAFFELKGKIESGQKNFGIHLVERLIAEHENLRKQNAELRKSQPYEVTQIAPAPLHVSDDEILLATTYLTHKKGVFDV